MRVVSWCPIFCFLLVYGRGFAWLRGVVVWFPRGFMLLLKDF